MRRPEGALAFVLSVMLVRLAQSLRPQTRSGSVALLMSTAAGAGAGSTPKLSVGSTLTNVDLAREAVRQFFPMAEQVTLTPTSGGVNNVVQYLELPGGEKKILRIYNNGLNTARVAFEHEILKQLNSRFGKEMSFKIPQFLPSIKDPSKTASGELNSMITKIQLDRSFGNGPTPPYFELYKVHHAVTRELFFKSMAGPDFDSTRPWADKMIKEVLELEATISRLQKLSLPFGLIHGDLHYDNVLCKDGRVTGLLDFEFASNDWRAMELAICLSKYAGEKDKTTGESIAMPFFTDFIDGFAEKGELTDPEIEAIPDLILLRVLSNVVYFVGRAIGGEDDISSLTTRIENYCGRVDWLKKNGPAISAVIKSKMRTNEDL